MNKRHARLASSKHQALALGLWHRIAKFIGGFNPQLDRFVGVGKGKLVSISVSNTAWRFWNFSNKDLIFVTCRT